MALRADLRQLQQPEKNSENERGILPGDNTEQCSALKHSLKTGDMMMRISTHQRLFTVLCRRLRARCGGTEMPDFIRLKVKTFTFLKAGLIMMCITMAGGCASRSQECLYSLQGAPDKEKGWTFLPSEKGKKVYIPFEGYYESKGGRIQSPRISLGKKSGRGAFYCLRFMASAQVQGYWWIDFFDHNGAPLPDINSALYASEKPEPYEEVFFADPRAESAVIAFVSKEGVSVRDIELQEISPTEAASWCDKLYAQLPQCRFETSPDAFAFLPKTKEALQTGKTWRILLLGDSIVNDTWTSNFQALVMRDFPNADLIFYISVRGTTGCWYYKKPEYFKKYVADFKPDLVMIGGISNNMNPSQNGDPEKNLISVIEQCKLLGCEVVVMSPPPSWEWRVSPEQADWSEDWQIANGGKPLQRDYQRNATEKTGTAYWDLTTTPCNTITNARKPMDWFRRDGVHNNDRGKQLIGQNLAAWFRMAKEK